jgi:hypothetical protein
MTEQEIVEFYDANLNMTLWELSQVTGWSIKALKKLLLEG